MITRKQWTDFLEDVVKIHDINPIIQIYFEDRYVIYVDKYIIHTYTKPMGEIPSEKWRKIYDYNWVMKTPHIKLTYLYNYLDIKMSYSIFKDNFR